MTKNEARERIRKIEDVKSDYEAAYSMEIELYKDFVDYVITTPVSKTTIRRVAQIVQSARHIDFPRYTA